MFGKQGGSWSCHLQEMGKITELMFLATASLH